MINHALFNHPLQQQVPKDCQQILFGMGCFWGAEKCFWSLQGVVHTAVGYAAGSTKDPDYRMVCSGETGHAEVVQVIYKPEIISTDELLSLFWENHNPTQGMRQGNDRGSQYRSMVICFNEQQLQQAITSKERYQQLLNQDGFSEITTEILGEQVFYLAEEEHQQYLHKNPTGYCGLGGTGTCF